MSGYQHEGSGRTYKRKFGRLYYTDRQGREFKADSSIVSPDASLENAAEQHLNQTGIGFSGFYQAKGDKRVYDD